MMGWVAGLKPDMPISLHVHVSLLKIAYLM